MPPSNGAIECANELSEPTKSWNVRADFKVQLTNFGVLIRESQKIC